MSCFTGVPKALKNIEITSENLIAYGAFMNLIHVETINLSNELYVLDFNSIYGSNILDVSALGYYLDNVRKYISSNQVASQTSSGLMSSADKKNLDTLVGLLQEDSDSVINTIQEVLNAFKDAPESFDIVTALSNKLDKSSVLTSKDVEDYNSWSGSSESMSDEYVLSSYSLNNILNDFAPKSMVPKVTIGANAPTGNKNGDIWFDTNTPS